MVVDVTELVVKVSRVGLPVEVVEEIFADEDVVDLEEEDVDVLM